MHAVRLHLVAHDKLSKSQFAARTTSYRQLGLHAALPPLVQAVVVGQVVLLTKLLPRAVFLAVVGAGAWG